MPPQKKRNRKKDIRQDHAGAFKKRRTAAPKRPNKRTRDNSHENGASPAPKRRRTKYTASTDVAAGQAPLRRSARLQGKPAECSRKGWLDSNSLMLESASQGRQLRSGRIITEHEMTRAPPKRDPRDKLSSDLTQTSSQSQKRPQQSGPMPADQFTTQQSGALQPLTDPQPLISPQIPSPAPADNQVPIPNQPWNTAETASALQVPEVAETAKSYQPSTYPWPLTSQSLITNPKPVEPPRSTETPGTPPTRSPFPTDQPLPTLPASMRVGNDISSPESLDPPSAPRVAPIRPHKDSNALSGGSGSPSSSGVTNRNSDREGDLRQNEPGDEDIGRRRSLDSLFDGDFDPEELQGNIGETETENDANGSSDEQVGTQSSFPRNQPSCGQSGEEPDDQSIYQNELQRAEDLSQQLGTDDPVALVKHFMMEENGGEEEQGEKTSAKAAESLWNGLQKDDSSVDDNVPDHSEDFNDDSHDNGDKGSNEESASRWKTPETVRIAACAIHTIFQLIEGSRDYDQLVNEHHDELRKCIKQTPRVLKQRDPGPGDAERQRFMTQRVSHEMERLGFGDRCLGPEDLSNLSLIRRYQPHTSRAPIRGGRDELTDKMIFEV